MLVFNDFILNVIDNLKIKDKDGILITNSHLNKEKENQEKTYDKFPGSIHFNISIKDIKNMNKLKFYLFIENSGKMDEWKIRNENVKEIKPLVDIFGPFVVETDFFDKFWQISFEYLDKHDKTKEVNPRVEIRYMGGENYTNQKNEISANIVEILKCIKIATTDKENDKYLELLKKKDIDRNFEKLKPTEIEFLKIIFNTNNETLIIEKYNDLKKQIEIKKLKHVERLKEIGDR